MDKLEKYKKIIKERLAKRADVITQNKTMSFPIIINKEETEFIYLRIGWKDDDYVHNLVHHIGIKDDKVWIYQDNTDVDIASILVKDGILQEDMVLGFLNPELRAFTEYAVA